MLGHNYSTYYGMAQAVSVGCMVMYWACILVYSLLTEKSQSRALVKVMGYPMSGRGHTVNSQVHNFHVDAYTAIISDGKQRHLAV